MSERRLHDFYYDQKAEKIIRGESGMKRRHPSVKTVLAAILLCTVCFLIKGRPVLAAESVILLKGYCGECHNEDGNEDVNHFNAPNVKFVLYRDGTMVVSGSGDMESYLDYEDCCTKHRIKDQMPWYGHRDRIKKLIIKDGITKIGWNNFAGCVNLESIKWPSTLESVYPYAFKGCTSLKEVTLPACVDEWFDHIFEGCTGLKKAILEPGVQFGEPEIQYGEVDSRHYGSNMFRDCTMLETVILPKNLKVIPVKFVFGCPNLRKFYIPEEIVFLGSYPASLCPKKVTLPKTLKHLGYGAFEDCVTLEELLLPDGLRSISTSFIGCKNLKFLKIPSSVLYFGYGAFMESGIEEITLPGNMETISERMFYKCRNLKEIRIPDSVRYINREAFLGCTNLRKVVLSQYLREIQPYAFAYCKNLTRVRWNPYGGWECQLADFAFLGCRKLEEFIIPEEIAQLGNMFGGCKGIKVKVRCTSDTFWGTNFFKDFPQTATIVVPKGKIGEFREAFLEFETDTYKIRVREGDV